MGRIGPLLLFWLLSGAFLGAQTAQPPSAPQVRFVFWNLKNYIGIADPNSPPPLTAPRKSAASAEAIHQILAGCQPDILLLAEMGGREDLHHLQRQLKEAGIDLPHVEYVDGPDPDRHLAMLSRFPLHSYSQADLKFDLGGRVDRMHRGLLEVDAAIGNTTLRILGLHLKSRRQVDDADEAEIRRTEAYLVRKRLKVIFAENPKLPILVAGDFNETKEGPTLRGLTAAPSDADRIRWINLEDADGTAWTYFSSQTDTYSRIDYVGTSRAFPWKVDRTSSICGGREVLSGSDHRPLVVVFNPDPE